MKWTCRPTIAVDTREQQPWSFSNLPSTRMTLQTGDYSVVGLVDRITIERKSLGDLLGTIGQGRDPDSAFMRRLERMRRKAK